MVESVVSAAHDHGGVDPRALARVAGFIDMPNSKFGFATRPRYDAME